MRMQEEGGSLADFEEESKQPGVNSQGGSLRADQNPKVVFKAAQIAPIVDRMGRMMIDFAPHLNMIVKAHQTRLRDLSNSQNPGLAGAQINLAQTVLIPGDAQNVASPSIGGEPLGNSHYRRLMSNNANALSPLESILSTIRNLNQVSRDIVMGGGPASNQLPALMN